MATVELEMGRIHYEEAGPPEGRAVVFVHGYLMGGSLFGELSTRLAARGLRCISPTWPLGAHTEAMKPDADVTPRGVATIIAAFLDALELEDV
ncbi:MAG TPA: alpha/beta hydrolase, partial [Solirubrobacteraceae bacterium]|nr:alpha/beta hydrolase [Solirubrobacteraceae bacterium]